MMRRGHLPRYLPYLLLMMATLAVYLPVVTFGFVEYDDNFYASENPFVRAGWSGAGLKWAFTNIEGGNWHPLTWLSLMLDAEIAGPRAGVFHGTNLLLHLVNTLLLFFLLERMTGAASKSAFVACAFAIHPLHVESVAWIAERKDVLSTLFWFLTLQAYLHYVSRPGLVRLLLVALPFGLGLASKPMLVTLPIVLLLLDYWPLGRLRPRGAMGGLIREKTPLLAMALASGIVTLVAQHGGGALATFEFYPLPARLANAVVACATYLAKTLWPANLAVFYPHPGNTLSPWLVAISTLVLAGISVLVYLARGRPYLTVGWLWYLVTLAPVIGLVQVGMQSMADRYTYVPLIGIFLMVAWGVPDLAARHGARWVPLVAVGAMGALMGCARLQVSYWRDGTTLFAHALRATSRNPVAENCLGNALLRRGRDAEAAEHWSQALRIAPDYADARSNLAGILIKQGRLDEAIAQCREVLRVNPTHVRAHTNLGLVLMHRGNYDEAAHHFSASLSERPNHAGTHANLAGALLRLGRLSEALSHIEQALRLEPDNVDAHLNLGIALGEQGRLDAAIARFSKVLRLDPGNETARGYLEAARAAQRRDP